MKFKEIKPGMVIHCPTEEDAKALCEHMKEMDVIDGDYFVENYGRQDGASLALSNTKGAIDCVVIHKDGDELFAGYSAREFFEKDQGLTITEFSDLVEPDNHPATTEDINWIYDPAKGYFDGKVVADLPINSLTDSPMTAVEVLEKLRRIDDDGNTMDIFGCSFENLFDFLSNEEIVDAITTYEAEKKKPKPVEVEGGYRCSICECDNNFAFEADVVKYALWDVTKEEAEADVMDKAKDYVSKTGKQVKTNIQFVCRVKEDEV